MASIPQNKHIQNQSQQQKLDETSITINSASQQESQFLKQFPNMQIKNLMQNSQLLRSEQQRIKKFFMSPQLKPQYFCSYAAFSKVFPSPNIYEAYRSENLNIIDLHLRYYQFIHEKMTVYKWLPSILVVAATKLNPIGLLFPLFYVKIFDKYFEKFMIWKYSNHKIINIRPQFITKLSKNKNILRRIMLFERLKPNLAKNNGGVPVKYIKFGQNTHYIFHTTLKGIEESSIYLTPLFQTFMAIKGINKDSLSSFVNHFKDLIESFKQYKKIDNKDELPIFINLEKMLTYKQVKKTDVYNVSKQVQLRLRRLLEIGKYYTSGKFFMSGLSLTDLSHLNKHYDLLTPQKYNFQTNTADFVLFYGTVLALKTVRFIIKRSIKM